MHRHRGAAAVAFVCLCAFTPQLRAQAAATIDVGGTLVEYEGFLTSGAAAISPTLRYDTPNLSVGAQGTWVVFESGNQIFQGTAAAAWLTPAQRGWRGELSGSMGLGHYADEGGYGHLFARSRLHYDARTAGGWVSAAAGQTFDGSESATPFELAAGAWTVHAPIALGATVTGTWLGSGFYGDAIGTVRWSRGIATVDARLGARGGSDGSGEGAYGEISALVSVNRYIAATVSGGQYPSDPARGVLGAKYVTLGIRLRVAGTRAPLPRVIAGAIERASRTLERSADASRARIEVAPSGNPRTLSVNVPGARSIEIMGDFTDWVPVALTQTGSDTWAVDLFIPPGVHRLNIRVDDGPWRVPLGTRLEETEFGGAVGVVVVP
jgi:hypothetical protein